MRNRVAPAVVIALVAVTLIGGMAPPARGVTPQSYMDDLGHDAVTRTDKAPDVLRIRSTKPNTESRTTTRTQIHAGFTATFVIKTDSTDLRLFYGDKGVVIFNWSDRVSELRHHDPRTGQQSGIPGAGTVPANKWVTITWTIYKNDSIIAVDGVERATFHGDYTGLQGGIGAGTYGKAIVTLKELTLEPPSRAIGGGKSGKDTAVTIGGGKGEAVYVSVPSAKPKAGESEPKPTPAADGADPVERPEFRDRPKALVKSLSSVTAMMVVVGNDGQATGLTSDIIATVPAQSRRGDKASVGFARVDGDATMRTAFDEAVRAVTLRYPLWQPGQIDISFGEKFVPHGGPSAGTAFGLLLLSTLEGFEIDPACAVTGDITVDWRVRKVGGVTAKLRGATLDRRALAAIPEDNEAAAADLAVLYGDAALWDVQIFSIHTLRDAVALARRDRAPKLAEAIKQFDELRPQLAKGGRPFLTKPATREALKAVAELAPNHLSARYLLAMSEGKFQRTLSANATMYQLSVIFYPYIEFLKADKPDRAALPAQVTAVARRRLNALRPMAHKDILPVVADMSAFVEAADGLVAGRLSLDKFMYRAQNLQTGFANLGSDPKVVEKLVHEAY